MNKTIIGLCAALGIVIGIGTAYLTERYESIDLVTASTIFEKSKDGVVLVAVESTNPEHPTGGLGTGFFISDNLIMTNYHVIEEAKAIRIFPYDSVQDYSATLVASSPIHDTALLKINDYDSYKKDHAVAILEFASEKAKVGQQVFAIGHPSGYEWTISTGIISGVNRTVDGPKMFIQTDTYIYPGNSGGPLLNKAGNVVGMNTLIQVTNGGSYGFAIDKTYLKKVMYDLVKYGKSQFVRAGLTLKLTEDKKNIIIENVTENGAGAKCGFQVNDVIEQVKTLNDTVYLDMNNTIKLVMKFNELNMDQTKVSFVVRRDGELMRKDCNMYLKDA